MGVRPQYAKQRKCGALSESVIGLCSFRQLHADIWLKAEGKSAVKGRARAGRTPPDGGAAPASPMAARCARWPSPAAPARPHDPFTQPPRYGARHSGDIDDLSGAGDGGGAPVLHRWMVAGVPAAARVSGRTRPERHWLTRIGAAIAWCRAWRARGRGLEPSPGSSCCALLYARELRFEV